MIVASSLGIGYAAILWLAALRVAHFRSLSLGAWPYFTTVLCGAVAALIVAVFPPELAVLLSASLIGTIVCALVDARTGLIFDVLSYGMIAVIGALALSSGHAVDGALAALVVGGTLYALHLGTRRRGIGLGDVKLAIALSLGYGLQLAVIAIGSAFILGAGYAGVLLATRRVRRSDALRFGPFIAGGAAVSLTANVLGYHW